MTDKFVSIKVKKLTKERIDSLSKFTGLNIIDVVDDAVLLKQYLMMRSLSQNSLEKMFEKQKDAIAVAKIMNEQLLKQQRGEKT